MNVETCFLTEDEKIKVCQLVTNAGADYIKTSTGFGTGGATIEDIRLFKANNGPNVKMKAAGGVKTVDDLIAFINEGCSRIGTSFCSKNAKGRKSKRIIKHQRIADKKPKGIQDFYLEYPFLIAINQIGLSRQITLIKSDIRQCD